MPKPHKNPFFYLGDYMVELTEGLKKRIMEEYGYSREEVEGLEVYTREELEDYLWDLLTEIHGKDIEQLLYYVDFDALIRDDEVSGYLEKIEHKGETLYFYAP